MSQDIRYLLDLNGSVLVMENGYFVKMEAKEVAKSEFRPHGLKYSLTLHDTKGERILGYDNAHAVKPGNGFKYAGQIVEYDHKHRSAGDEGIPYNFQNAEILLTDFWNSVNKILAEVDK